MRKKLANKKIKIKVFEIFPPEEIIDVFPPFPVAKKVAIRIEKKKIKFSDFWYGIKGAAVKIICLLTIISLNWFGLSAIINTVSYLNDIENSSGNSFTAGTLDFDLNSPWDFTPSCLVNGESATRDIIFLNNDNLPKYKISATNFSGLLCQYLNIEASLDDKGILYSGSLSAFINGPVEFENPEVWHLKLILPADAPEGIQGETCQFNIVFLGSQIRNDLPFGEGFNDTEEVTNTISACGTGGPEPSIVINEVYYDADSRKACTAFESDPLNEWIEIYNPTPDPIDISGWVIKDNGGQDVIPSSPVIPGNGFAVIAKNSSTWKFWNIPDSVVKITLGNLIGDGLANDGDRVILKDLDGVIVDQMSYEGDTSIWNPAPPLDGDGYSYDLPNGHSLGRDPDGFDTDMANDWKDFANPTPGALTNNPQVKVIIPNGGEIWYLGNSYNLQWLAVDPWGKSENLSIDIWYSKDSGQSWFYQILHDFANTGIYQWLIPNDSSLVSSHARIKVSATNYEKLTGWDMSDCDFCPPTEGDDIIVEEQALEEETAPEEETLPETPTETPTETPADAPVENPTPVSSGGGITPTDQPSSPETSQEQTPTQEEVTPETVTPATPDTPIVPEETQNPEIPQTEETPAVIPTEISTVETNPVNEQVVSTPATLPEEITGELPPLETTTTGETTPSETAPESNPATESAAAETSAPETLPPEAPAPVITDISNP